MREAMPRAYGAPGRPPYAAPVTLPAAPLDLGDPAVVADPYPSFAAARPVAPVQWHEGLGLWLAFTHAAANAVLRDRRLGRIWRDKEPAERFGSFNLIHRNAILEMEPPDHTRLRRLISAAFARGHVERLRPWVEELYTSAITSGCLTNPLRYCPDSPNTRGQMAVFLVKTFNLQ